MIYVDLSLSKIKEKLVAYGLTKTSSKRFIRYEGYYKDSCIKYGVEISQYHNIYELTCYVTGVEQLEKLIVTLDRNKYVDKIEREMRWEP